jgi:hypothetical protein
MDHPKQKPQKPGPQTDKHLLQSPFTGQFCFGVYTVRHAGIQEFPDLNRTL